MYEVSLLAITGYAFADAIDPCSLSALILILVAVVTRGYVVMRHERSNVLRAGLSFASAVFISYFILGMIIMYAFRAIELSSGPGPIPQALYSILGAIAIAFGVFSLKDAVWAKRNEHRSTYEMVPSFLRVKLIKISNSMTGAQEAFTFGMLITFFLTPLTMGPYLITSGMLSAIDVAASVPWLLFYNLIFILPLLFITFTVYAKHGAIERISGWKGRDRFMHVLVGIVMLSLGLAMLAGLI